MLTNCGGMKMKTIQRCRLCACEQDLEAFCNIFGGDSTLNIEMKISKLLPIVVMPWDPMPHKICHSCIDKLNSFDEFYESSIRAERFLRSLRPSAPEAPMDNFDPVVEVLEPPVLGKVPFQRRVAPPSGHDGMAAPEWGERTQNCFIINELTSRDSIFTCRKCFRTFTKESSALTHTCVRLEDCKEFGELDVEVGVGEGREKLLPPLKIRLFSVESGLFICDLCQSPFEDKTELVAHIKRHFMEGRWDEEERESVREEKVVKKRNGMCVEEEEGQERQKGGEEEEEEEEEEEDKNWLENVRKRMIRAARTGRKRKKKCEKPGGRRRGRPRKVDVEGGECRGAICDSCNGHVSSGSTIKETVESTTQYSDFASSSEDEIDIKYEKVQKMVENILKEEEKSNEKVDVKEICLVAREETEEKLLKETLFETNASSEVVLDEDEVILLEGGDRAEDVTVLQVVSNKTPTSFSSCVICDKIFATKNALIAHQQKHLQACSGLKFEDAGPHAEPFLCSICAMTFTSRKTLVEHEQYHLVDVDAIG